MPTARLPFQPSQDYLAAMRRPKSEMAKVIVGQHSVLEELLIVIFARGHCLLIGVPVLAKTLMNHTLADAINLSYNRIQFTPDLMPLGITGTEGPQEITEPGSPVRVRALPGLRQCWPQRAPGAATASRRSST